MATIKKKELRNPQQHEFHNYVERNRPDVKEHIQLKKN